MNIPLALRLFNKFCNQDSLKDNVKHKQISRQYQLKQKFKMKRIMKLRPLGILLVLLFLSTQALSRTSIEDYVKEGIGYHDKGDYDKAIETYKKALKIDKKSTLVNYEIALSYYRLGNYKKAIKHCDIVLKQDEEHILAAYITKGNALDLLGKTKKSIQLLKKGIKETGGHYLLYYNLSYNYFKIEDYNNAEESAIKAVEDNPSHSSSHFLLSNINLMQGNKIRGLLAIHYFLLKEPNSKRSEVGMKMLKELMGGNVSKEAGKPNTINITISPNGDD